MSKFYLPEFPNDLDNKNIDPKLRNACTLALEAIYFAMTICQRAENLETCSVLQEPCYEIMIMVDELLEFKIPNAETSIEKCPGHLFWTDLAIVHAQVIGNLISNPIGYEKSPMSMAEIIKSLISALPPIPIIEIIKGIRLEIIQNEETKKYTIMPHEDDDDLDPYEARLLLHLRRLAGVHGRCAASIQSMANKTKMSERKVRECLKLLESTHERICVNPTSGQISSILLKIAL